MRLPSLNNNVESRASEISRALQNGSNSLSKSSTVNMEPMMGAIARTSQGAISRSQELTGAGSIPQMSNTLRDRITQRLEELDKTQRAASLEAGLSESAIRDIFRRPDTSPSIDTIRKLAIALETTPEWLAFGVDGIGTFGWKPEAWKSQSKSAEASGDDQPGGSDATLLEQKLIQVAIVGPVEAGAFREAPEYEPDDTEYVPDYPDREFPYARRMGFKVRGDSMNDLKPRPMLEGDKVVGLVFHDIEGQVILRDGLVVVVEQTRDGGHTREWSVKQLEIHEDRYEFCPRSTSRRHKPIVVPKKVFHDPSEDDGRQVRILALVRRIISDVAI